MTNLLSMGPRKRGLRRTRFLFENDVFHRTKKQQPKKKRNVCLGKGISHLRPTSPVRTNVRVVSKWVPVDVHTHTYLAYQRVLGCESFRGTNQITRRQW